MTRAGQGERRRLGELFGELCAIPSPFGHERSIADRVLAELRGLGAIDIEEDESGNLLARVAGAETGAPCLLLCGHLDTVPHEGAIEPVCEEGVWRNRLDGAILGADNKAALAVMLLAARRLASSPAQVGLELLFTVAEENALQGAKRFDVGRLRSRFGYVFDHATPIGEVVLASPTYYRVEAEYAGEPAHAGIRPEHGRSAILAAARAVAAMELGRLDPETTANIGVIEGGSGVNVVPARCRLVGEVRSLEPARAEAAVGQMVDHLHDGAGSAGCDVDVIVTRQFDGYRTRPGEPAIAVADEALRDCGFVPRHISTGGGSDANALMSAGYPCCVNLANGTERNHQPDECVSVAALDTMLDVCLALVERAGAAAPAAA